MTLDLFVFLVVWLALVAIALALHPMLTLAVWAASSVMYVAILLREFRS